jgi:hypothetical protein
VDGGVNRTISHATDHAADRLQGAIEDMGGVLRGGLVAAWAEGVGGQNAGATLVGFEDSDPGEVVTFLVGLLEQVAMNTAGVEVKVTRLDVDPTQN